MLSRVGLDTIIIVLCKAMIFKILTESVTYHRLSRDPSFTVAVDASDILWSPEP